MKRKLLSILLAVSMIVALAACGGSNNDGGNNGGTTPGSTPTSAPSTGDDTQDPGTDASDIWSQLTNGEMVDGKFVETRKITVEVYDRGNDGGSDPENNMYTEYIKKGMLEDHNVEVEFVSVPRWTETEQINNLLAAQDAPDVCYTYSYPTIQTYANMGTVTDLGPLVDNYKELLPNLWGWLGDFNINYDRDPDTGELWAIEAKLATSNRIVTYIRKDWLDTLGIAEPTTKDEFYAALCAFRDNAETLLGSDADKLIPFGMSFDVGWRAALLIESFMDPDISDREFYVNGFDDRRLLQNGTKEAVRVLNQWYNEDLMWKDFVLYGSGDGTEDDMMKAGYIGAFMHNWDYPFRNGEDSIAANLKRLVGPDAAYVAIDCFEDKNGNYTKFVPGSVDRKIFFPTTNDETLASMMYLDWISNPEHIEYLQIGDEGVTHNKLADGAIQTIAATGDAIMNSGMNIDYTMTCNGLKLVDPEQTALSIANNYAGVDPALVARANEVAQNDIIVAKHATVGAIVTEEGMGEALSRKRDVVFDNAVIAAPADFDSVWDQQISEYLSMGGQAIIDEREAKWQQYYGDVDMLPEE